MVVYDAKKSLFYTPKIPRWLIAPQASDLRVVQPMPMLVQQRRTWWRNSGFRKPAPWVLFGALFDRRKRMRNSLDSSSWRGSADLNVHGQRLDDTSYIDWVVSAWSGLFYWVPGSQCATAGTYLVSTIKEDVCTRDLGNKKEYSESV